MDLKTAALGVLKAIDFLTAKFRNKKRVQEDKRYVETYVIRLLRLRDYIENNFYLDPNFSLENLKELGDFVAAVSQKLDDIDRKGTIKSFLSSGESLEAIASCMKNIVKWEDQILHQFNLRSRMGEFWVGNVLENLDASKFWCKYWGGNTPYVDKGVFLRSLAITVNNTYAIHLADLITNPTSTAVTPQEFSCFMVRFGDDTVAFAVFRAFELMSKRWFYPTTDTLFALDEIKKKRAGYFMVRLGGANPLNFVVTYSEGRGEPNNITIKSVPKKKQTEPFTYESSHLGKFNSIPETISSLQTVRHSDTQRGIEKLLLPSNEITPLSCSKYKVFQHALAAIKKDNPKMQECPISLLGNISSQSEYHPPEKSYFSCEMATKEEGKVSQSVSCCATINEPEAKLVLTPMDKVINPTCLSDPMELDISMCGVSLIEDPPAILISPNLSSSAKDVLLKFTMGQRREDFHEKFNGAQKKEKQKELN